MKNKIYNQLSEKYVDVEGKRIARVPSNINYIKENHHPTKEIYQSSISPYFLLVYYTFES